MKPYNSSKRTFLKVGSKTKKLVDAVSEEAKNALLSEELKTKHNRISIGFNAPENPATTARVTVNLGGPDNKKIQDILFDRYKDAINKQKENSCFGPGTWKHKSDDHFYLELKLKVKGGAA